jgi:exodeoxyribonuclease V alpha subunit
MFPPNQRGASAKPDTLRGVVERITYANAEKGYSVLKIRCKGYAELIPVVGNMASICVGTVVTVVGKWTHNPKFGRQFNAESWEESLPASAYGLEKYLGSGLIKGIGPKFAKLIVQKFGAETMDVIENAPERLIEIDNIGHKRVAMIQRAWAEQKEIKNIMIFLQEHGVSTAFGYRIFKQYGGDSIAVLRENPYRMADDIWGVGFITADTVAQKLGMDLEAYPRCRAGIFYVLNKLADEGHCFCAFEQLAEKSAEILKIDHGKIAITLGHLIGEKELIAEAHPDGQRVYLPPFFYAEAGVAKRIRAIAQSPNINTPSALDDALTELQNRTEITYEQTQIFAIRQALLAKFSVITGGPGTGKTTITQAIIRLFLASGKTVILAAPTGRAAKRLSEVSGLEAKTIHRLLAYKPPTGFAHNAENPLTGDVLILDECSMIDVILMYNLLKAVPEPMTVLLVGDVDQLPSVGAGNVLNDVIDSAVIPVTRLT